jgi:FdhE protein
VSAAHDRASSLVSSRLSSLRRDQPALQPWLSVIEIALAAAADPAWEASALAVAPAAEGEVALAGASIPVDRKRVAALLERLLTAAAKAPGGDDGWRLVPARLGRLALDSGARWLAATIGQDPSLLDEVAARLEVPTAVVMPIADLAALPLLQACGRRFADRCAAWSQGHCPICGAWPTLAEMRGLERGRRLRCRCGADWGSVPLLCPYCGNVDHETLTSLVPEKGGESRRIDACNQCRGYLKALAQLGPIRPELLALEDLASVELDLAAIERGYQRPQNAPGARGVAITER